MDRFDEQLRADLRRAAQRPAVQTEWSAVRERASALRRRRAALRTAPIATMILLGGLGYALMGGQQNPRVSVQSPSVEESTPRKSPTTVSVASAESTVVTIAVPAAPTTNDQPGPDTTDEAGEKVGGPTETNPGGGTVAKRPATTLAGSRPTTTMARPGTSVTPPNPAPTPAPTTAAPAVTRSGSCLGGSITVRISPNFALLSTRPAPGFHIVENETQYDEVKVKFSDDRVECTVRIRSDGRVETDG